VATHSVPPAVSVSAPIRLLRSFWVGAPVEEGEIDAIEANEAAIGREPQVAVLSLADGVDGVLGQTVVGLPELLAVLAERLSGIERLEWWRG